MSFVVLSVSGPNGANGHNGRDAAIPSGSYKNGNDGEDATKPTRGKDAGVPLNRDNTTGASIEFSGQYRKSEQFVDENFQETYSCETVDLFVLDAHGGSGGHGGYGGDGGYGATGHSGMDATRYSNGTNGGRGGDGGDAGAGTSGANGGKGGAITLHMRDTDSGLLLMFVKVWTPTISYSLNISGGQGGRAGQHGTPGRGGYGGRGGSGYSWTETHSYTDSRGYTQYTTTSHYNPGGFSGPSGSSGRRPTHPLYNGISGIDGNFRFLIEDSVTNYITEYHEIFDIRIHQVIIHSITGVFEPEAQIHLDTLTILNLSEMPTPRRDICITINDSIWIRNQEEKEHIILPQLINPYTTKKVDCDQPFTFSLKKHRVKNPGPPLRDTDTLHLTATMTGLKRWLPAFDINGLNINIKYPIELTHISHMNSMVVGHVAKVIWGVENTTEVDFGSLSKNGRCIRVRLGKTSGEVSSSALRFGLQPEQEGVATIPPEQTLEKEYIFEIPLLKAGQTLQLEATLTLGEAEIFECAEFWIYLELGKINNPSIPNVVHIESFNVRVSTIYRGFPAGFYPDVLLVANHRTTRNEFLAWDNLLKQQFGLRFFIWDISQMGHFHLTRPIPILYSTEPTTLMKDLAGKTMIILDNQFDYGDYAIKVTARNFVLKHEWLQAIHKNDNKFYVVNPKANKNDCVIALNELISTPFDALRQKRFTFERVRNFTQQHLVVKKTDDSSELPDDASVDGEQFTTDPAILIDEVIEVQIKAKIFRNIKKRMFNKAIKVDKKLKKFRPHIQHLVHYQWHEMEKRSLIQTFKNRDKINKMDGGCITILPYLTTTKRRIIFAAYAWNASPAEFILLSMNIRGVIAGLGIDDHFRLLERIFVTGPISEDNETDNVGLFLTGGHRILDENERQLAEILKRQIIYDVAVELSIICDGNNDNSSLEDAQVLEMLENLRRLVWKVESLSGISNLRLKATKEEKPLPAIPEENEDVSSQHSIESSRVQFNDFGDAVGETPQIYDDLTTRNVPDTTAAGDLGEVAETVFYIFPVKHDTLLGEWMMDALAHLYAFIKCLRAGINQSILPNRRTAKVQQQSMDLLHRIGDATIIDFVDPRSSAKLESIRQEQLNQTSKELPNSSELLIIGDEKSKRSISMVLRLSSEPSIIGNEKLERSKSMEFRSYTLSAQDESQDHIFDDSTSSTSPISISNQFNGTSVIPSPLSVASGLSFASAMTSATRISSTSFSSSGTSASRSRILYKKLDPERRLTIKSFKRGVKLQLQNMIQKHYNQWKKDANYNFGGVFDPSRKDLRRNAMETIFGPFESLVDNTLYGRNFEKKRDGQVGGVKNIVVTDSIYSQQRANETIRNRNMENMISKFLDFQNRMIKDTI
ncbi:9451_t:CDS:10 [Funneliformis geosporum]|nr:9451_t:CDS:10 [Funneliformis geosporum]